TINLLSVRLRTWCLQELGPGCLQELGPGCLQGSRSGPRRRDGDSASSGDAGKRAISRPNPKGLMLRDPTETTMKTQHKMAHTFNFSTQRADTNENQLGLHKELQDSQCYTIEKLCLNKTKPLRTGWLC
ncbi:mCG144874, partial [Mus musculus]